MAVKFEQVEDSEKEAPGVEPVAVPVGGQEITTYWRRIFHDDLNPEVTEDVFTVEILAPVMSTEEYETDEQNEDGSFKLATRPCMTHERREVDLGKESMEKLLEALKPFLDASREAQPLPQQAKKRRAKAPRATVDGPA
ncbi:hypothetical protein [Streptomyces sp. UNOB3_S3]|uniref:hypothetical protein n=1 Tax=Streptomyces sp. UNOB3_S3 TaxID=2871682 RepID=UPI001E327BAF|nr:hypothetical protein [Streptomyces sp. UNOB3_S3]MCC3778769.1 hypothetical protein [Streptomyces sp. UNOB3_S3]